ATILDAAGDIKEAAVHSTTNKILGNVPSELKDVVDDLSSGFKLIREGIQTNPSNKYHKEIERKLLNDQDSFLNLLFERLTNTIKVNRTGNALDVENVVRGLVENLKRTF